MGCAAAATQAPIVDHGTAFLRYMAFEAGNKAALLVAVPAVLTALQDHAGSAAIAEHGLRCLWGLATHADNRGPLLAAVPTALAALATHATTPGVVQVRVRGGGVGGWRGCRRGGL